MGGRDTQGTQDGHVHTAIFTMDNQQGPTVQHGSLFSVMWQPGWKESLGENGYMYGMADSLCCPQHCYLAIPQCRIKSLKREKKKRLLALEAQPSLQQTVEKRTEETKRARETSWACVSVLQNSPPLYLGQLRVCQLLPYPSCDMGESGAKGFGR